METSEWMNGSVEPTGVGGELQVSEGSLLGEAVEQLAGFAVLVAGRQLQRGQFLHRVLVQDQAFVDHHRWRQAVLWGGGGHTHKNIRCTQKKTHTHKIFFAICLSHARGWDLLAIAANLSGFWGLPKRGFYK